MAVTVRALSFAVTFDGVDMAPIALSARGRVVADSGWPTCSVFLTEYPTTTPGTQNSGAGIPGKPGSKSGPAMNRAGETTGSNPSDHPAGRAQDAAKVPGMPGNKSGPAVRPPSSGSNSR